MTDKDKPSSYPYYLFSSRDKEMVQQQPPTSNSCSSYTGSCERPPQIDEVAVTQDHSAGISHCPRCYATVSSELNWCPACGELLIGANIYSENRNWNMPGNTFHPPPIARSDSSIPEWYLTNGYHVHHTFGASHFHQKTHSLSDCANYSRRAFSRLELSPMFDASSLAMATSFSPTVFSTSTTLSENHPVSSTDQANSAYHVAETSVPYCDSQIESLQSSLNQLHMAQRPITSLHYSYTFNHEQSAPLEAFRGSLLNAPSSIPDTIDDGHIYQAGRQRCISGPVQTPILTTERSFFWNANETDYFPVHSHISSGYSSPSVHYNARITQPCNNIGPSFLHHSQSFLTNRGSDNRMNVAVNDSNPGLCRSRRKHASECSESAQAHTITNSNIITSSYRPRSFTPDLNGSSSRICTTVERSTDHSCDHTAELSGRPFTADRSNHMNRAHVFQSQGPQARKMLSMMESKISKRKPRKRQVRRKDYIRMDRDWASCTAAADDQSLELASPVPEVDAKGIALPLQDNADPPLWLSLPSELWSGIIAFLPPRDRSSLALVCRRLSALVRDPSLWRVIQLHRHQHLDDSALASIGRLRPVDLRFSYCHGNGIAEHGLRRLFELCGSTLHKLSFVGCTKGLFDGDLTLLLAARHCPNLTQVDFSYTSAVRDKTIITLAKSARHLITVKLNGAQQISNSAIQQLVRYHKDTLQRLELFGCFRLNSDIFTVLSCCRQLRALAFGHLHHLSSDGLLELVGKLPLLSSLDLRGTQTLSNDTNLSHLAEKCPHLEEVFLANMLSVKHEAGIAQMLRRLPRLRVLDLCGLVAVGDLTMEALSVGCPQLEELDVSCTSVTHTGLSHLIRSPATCLRCLRISNCRLISKDVLENLVKACTKLTVLHAYGFKSITDWSFLRAIRPTLRVESDS